MVGSGSNAVRSKFGAMQIPTTSITIPELIAVGVLASMLIGVGVLHQKTMSRIEALELRATGSEKRQRRNINMIIGLYARMRLARHNINNAYFRLHQVDKGKLLPDWQIKNVQEEAKDEMNGDIFDD